MPDARKSLKQLHQEWAACTRCQLGKLRDILKSEPVFGQGHTQGVMIIGEGPNEEDAATGFPFSATDTAGKLLRELLQKRGLSRVYFTNLVMCRSCAPVLDEQQRVRIRNVQVGNHWTQVPMINDTPPPPPAIKECEERLLEEIYLVDPIVIVAVGPLVASTLLKRAVAITKEHGVAEEVSFPGAGYVPSLTEKRGAWARKVRGKIELPVVRSEVKYLVVPILPLDFVLGRILDRGPNNPVAQLTADLAGVAKTIERYYVEALHQIARKEAPVEVNVPIPVEHNDEAVPE